MKWKTLITAGLYRSFLPVVWVEKLLFFAVHRYWPNLEKPESFAEKVVWRKCQSDYNLPLAELSDKVAVRQYVERKIGPEHLIPLLFSGPEISSEQLLNLGDDIVVKLNNDCGSAEVITENSIERATEVAAKMALRIQNDFGKQSNQGWYSEISPLIMVEERLKDWQDKPPSEYQLFLFRKTPASEPIIIFSIAKGRGTSDHSLNYFDANGAVFRCNGQLISSNYRNGGFPFPHPEHREQLIEIADKLSAGIDHVRVDLYLAKDQIYFGELTFSSGGGRIKWDPAEFDDVLGSLWGVDCHKIVSKVNPKAVAIGQ